MGFGSSRVRSLADAIAKALQEHVLVNGVDGGPIFIPREETSIPPIMSTPLVTSSGDSVNVAETQRLASSARYVPVLWTGPTGV